MASAARFVPYAFARDNAILLRPASEREAMKKATAGVVDEVKKRLARDGVAASGSPWWVDTLDVGAGEEYDLALVADNPGVWADHCHDLRHAAEGLVAHLAYGGVHVPFRIGGEAGKDAPPFRHGDLARLRRGGAARRRRPGR